MKVLFIGGTGLISTAVSRLALEKGIDLYLLNRGNHPIPEGAKSLIGDINNDPEGVAQLLKEYRFDVVGEFIGFQPSQVQRDIELFKGKIWQYIFISSSAAYAHPAPNYIVTESSPLGNRYWQYGRNKQACEELLRNAYREDNFPATIIRPSLTYGETQSYFISNSWNKPYTLIHRMLQGKKIVVPGDGTGLFPMTFNTDFAKGYVGLMGNTAAIGETFHITTDEALTWNQALTCWENALGRKADVVHIPTDFIVEAAPEWVGDLLGDKAQTVVFDNSKIKRFVPSFHADVTYQQGIARAIAWYLAHEEAQVVDEHHEMLMDKIVEKYLRK